MRIGADFDKAPDRRAIHGNAVFIPQDLRDFAIAFAMPPQVTNDLGDRFKLALKRSAALEVCGSYHPAIEEQTWRIA